MKTLARERDQAEIFARLRQVRPDSVRRWGRMSVHQMVCHLADAHRMALGQKAATAGSADIVAIARGAGIDDSRWVRDVAHFEQLIARRFEAGGPVLLAAKIDEAPGTAQPPRDPPLIRHRFMQGLGTGRTSALDG